MKNGLPWAIIVLLLGWIVWHGRETSALRARSQGIVEQLVRVDTVRKTDSVKVVRLVRALDTVRQTVLDHITDTVIVKQYIARTDTLRVACLACVASAAKLSVVADSLRAVNADLLRATQSPKWHKYLPLAAGIVGFTLGAKLRP